MVGIPGTSSGAVGSHRSPVSRNVTKTSTPVKVKALRVREKKRECKRGKYIKRRSLQVAEKELRVPVQICLSPSSRSEVTQEGDQNVASEFDSQISSVNEELRRILSELNESSIPPMNNSQDPVAKLWAW